MKKNVFRKKTREGSYIIESLIAVSLVVVGLVGILRLVARSTNMNKDVENRVVATYLAAEGIEVIKNIIDSNVEAYNVNKSRTWNQELDSSSYEVQFDTNIKTLINLGGASSTRPLFFEKSTGNYSYANGEVTPYIRTIRIRDSGEKITVDSIVEWMSEGKKYSVFLEDVFTNWRHRNTPVYIP